VSEPAGLPTAPELLEASPNIRRLCEGYHRSHRHMVTRSRRQKLGLGLLVSGVGVGVLLLSRSGSAPAQTLSSLVVAVGVASAVALGLLALLWVRDDQRLRNAQGDRLMRALQFNCELPEERLAAFRRVSHPTTAFFDCYAVWQTEHPDHATGLALLVAAFNGSRRRAAA